MSVDGMSLTATISNTDYAPVSTTYRYEFM